MSSIDFYFILALFISLSAILFENTMTKSFILHMFTTAKNLSPFDVNMAIDAGWLAAIPYINVEPTEVTGLIQDTIFSRSPKGLKNTGIFIGGRDTALAMDMLKSAKAAMFTPFEVSVFADPSGAFTTAAAMVAVVENELKLKFQTSLSGKNILVLGGTGPVGQIAAVLSAQAGANVRIIGRRIEKAQQVAERCNNQFGAGEISISAGINADKADYIKSVDVIFSTGAAGIELLSKDLITSATQLKVASDVNAVPPSGVAGLDAFANGKEIAGTSSGAVGIGALAIGNVKYQVQSISLKEMIET